MSKKIVIDCGHGGNGSTQGKRSSVTQVGQMVYEWNMNNAVGLKIQTLLKDYDVIVYRTDDVNGKTDISLANRVSKTNSIKPDVFISIHHNAGGGTGTETYWHTSGSSKDKQLATIIQKHMGNKVKLRNRGVKQAQFYVLGCNSSIPAVLVEGGFYDTKLDFDYLMSSAGQQAYAEAVVEGIVEFLGLKKITTTTSTPTTTQEAEKVKTVNCELKVKFIKQVNIWVDTKFKIVKGHVAKGRVVHVTKKTADGNFYVIDGGYVSTSSEFSLCSKMNQKPICKVMPFRDCTLFTYSDGKYGFNQLKAWNVYEAIEYKDGYYHIYMVGWCHESHLKRYALDSLSCTNGVI